MLRGEIAMQRMDVSDILIVCLTGDVKKGVTIYLEGLNLTPFTKGGIVTFTAYTRALIALIPVCHKRSLARLGQCKKGTHFLK